MIYAVNSGDYLGEFFVYMESNENEYRFLSLPKMQLRKVPKDKFKFDEGIHAKSQIN